MIRIHRHKRRSVPSLNTASLPDLIFTVLFFFMIVTHMRKVTPQLTTHIPEGTELTQNIHKGGLVYIYINKEGQLQLGEKIGTVADIGKYIEAERKAMSSEDREQMTVVLKADRKTPMGIINQVKQALRTAGAYSVSYSATQKTTPTPKQENK
ncbi:MAG: biopolymer transporter ExbD [Prevotella sp.]|nr:biopolymer transporter ExbD [Prevotella sp.]